MKNHSQIEELRLADEKLYYKITGRGKYSPLGSETPLGHAYSIILEELFENNLDATPEPNSFLDTIKKEMIRGGECCEAKYLRLEKYSYYGTITDGIMKYMVNKGMSDKSCAQIMKKILGPDCGRTFAFQYKLINIERFFKKY